MNIKIYPFAHKYEDWVFTFVSFLQQDSEFEKLVLSLRNRLEIPENGLTITDWSKDFNKRYLNWKLIENQEKFKILSNGVKAIIGSYFLPVWWNYPLSIFTVYGVLPLYGNKISVEPSGEGIIKIKFSESVTQTEFIRWVKKRWQLFEWAFPNVRNSWKVRIKQNTIPIYERIIELKDVNKFHFSKIADTIGDELLKKYGDDFDPDVRVNEGSVKQMYHRYKKYLKQFKSPK